MHSSIKTHAEPSYDFFFFQTNVKPYNSKFYNKDVYF